MQSVESRRNVGTIANLIERLKVEPYLLNGVVRVVMSGQAFIVEQGRVTESVRLRDRSIRSIFSRCSAAPPSIEHLQTVIDWIRPSTSSIVLTKLKNASTPEECSEILENSIRSIEELSCVGCVAENELFDKIKEPVLKHISTLVADKHVKKMLGGELEEADTHVITKCLAQHRDFTRVSCDNALFNDAACYIRSDLSVENTNGLCELICRIRGCTANALKVTYQEVVDSGAQSLFESARAKTGSALRETRKLAVKKGFVHLDRVSFGKSAHLLFLHQIITNTNREIEDLLLAKLKIEDREPLWKEMAKLRASACVADLSGKKSFRNELEDRMEGLYQRCFVHKPVASDEQVVAILLDGQILDREMELLNYLTVGARNADNFIQNINRRWLYKALLEQFTIQLKAHYLTKFFPNEDGDPEQIVANNPLLQALKNMTKQESFEMSPSAPRSGLL